ncbi:MAG: hypothetical protein JWR26_1348 [Pedosphaera sp.]|nr:hypothetical protein [Pedosphaera sp.]
MPTKFDIEFVAAAEPIRGRVTKFGGQPVWISKPEWPISRSTKNPMRFIGQICIDPELFGGGPDRMAYLFMTDDGDEPTACTWDPNDGENAVIIQPGENSAPTIAQEVGLTLQRQVEGSPVSIFGKLMGRRSRLTLQECEFGVALSRASDLEFLEEEDLTALPEDEQERYSADIGGNKIGGTPSFIQNPEFPFDDSRKLLLQLDSADVPFSINFGDAGIGHLFLSADAKQGKFLWQCC